MFKQLLISLLSLLLLVKAPLVFAQDLKVGFIDKVRVLKEAPQSELARKKLKEEFSPRDDNIVNMQNRLKSLTDQQKNDAGLLSKVDVIKLERQIVSIRRDIKRAREEFNEDFNLRRNEELAKLHKLIAKMTVEIAKEQDYDIILGDNVLYINKRVDITDMVIKRLQKYQKASAGSAQKSK